MNKGGRPGRWTVTLPGDVPFVLKGDAPRPSGRRSERTEQNKGQRRSR
jgi:hypothetical protein